MNRHHIELTAEERDLVAKIDMRDRHSPGDDGHTIYLANRAPILALLKSLADRHGIPQRRIDYWTKPSLNPGHTKGSHRDVWAKNGSAGDEAYTHPNFMRFLRYFLFGADLPQPVIDEFEAQVGNPEWFSGSDILGLTKRTRELVRRHNLRGHWYPEAFLMLALDNGLDDYEALSVRKAAIDAGRR